MTDEYTRRIDALDRRIDAFEAKLQDLKNQLFGDTEARAVYETNRKNNTTPNIPEPTVGLFDTVMTSIEVAGRMSASKLDALAATLKGVQRLEQFFSPMLADPSASGINVHHIATKDYVDKGIATFAQAIRGELVLSYNNAKDLATAFMRSALGSPRQEDHDAPVTWYEKVVRRLAWAEARERERFTAELERARRPSRVQSFIHAVTGYTKPSSSANATTTSTNGAR